MTDFPHGDPRFFELREALASYAADPDDPPVHTEEYLEAAVSVVLRGRERMELLLIKRATSKTDPWSGHMALPGGRRDPGDESLLATAVRETREETALDLAVRGEPLGRLGAVAPSSVRLPRLTISPFVFGVAPGARASAASHEVEAIRWVEVETLRDPAHRETLEIRLEGGSRRFPCIRVGEDDVVWGLTYRIVTEFLEVFAGKGDAA